MATYSQYQRSSHVVTRLIGKDMVLVPVRGERGDLENLFRLNHVGSFLWDRLEESRSMEELIVDLVESFDVDRNIAQSDVQSFLDDLSEAGLLAETKRK